MKKRKQAARRKRAEENEELTEKELAALRRKAVRSLRSSLEEMAALIEDPDVAKSIKIKVAHAIAQTCGVLTNMLKAMGAIDPYFRDEAREFIERIMSDFRPRKWIRDSESLRLIIDGIIKLLEMFFKGLSRGKAQKLDFEERIRRLEQRTAALETMIASAITRLEELRLLAEKDEAGPNCNSR